MSDLSEFEKQKAERLYKSGTGIQAIAYFIGRGLGPVKCYIDRLKRLGVVPERAHRFEAEAVEYEEGGRTIKRYPPGWAEGAAQTVTARPRKQK